MAILGKLGQGFPYRKRRGLSLIGDLHDHPTLRTQVCAVVRAPARGQRNQYAREGQRVLCWILQKASKAALSVYKIKKVQRRTNRLFKVGWWLKQLY